MRLITNLIRTGIVTEVDRDGWLCRVKTGDLETNWINWLTYRAGKSRTWWCPSPGSRWCCSAGRKSGNSFCASGHLLQRVPAAVRL
jgi:phage baseplate assembly protein V